MDNNIIQIQGSVVDILSRNNDPKNQSITFKLKSIDGKDYRIFCPFFCTLQNYDGFFGVGRLDDINNITILKLPYVSIPVDKDNTMQFFLKNLTGTKFGNVSAQKLYNEIETLAKNFEYGKKFQCSSASISEKLDSSYSAIDMESRFFGDGVIPFLTEYASRYCESKDERIIDLFAGKIINKLQTKRLLESWHNKRSLRKLYLLGLTRTEITNSNKNLEELYKICLDNPYRIPSIPFEKCEKILGIFGKIPTDIQKECGRINRFVYENDKKKTWFCTPDYIVRKTLPKYDTYKDLLQREYSIIEINDKIYILNNYKIEKRVSEYINSLIISTIKKFSNTKISPSIDTNFYECKTLTDEQKNAITGSLKSDISIICGGAGVGKTTILKEIARNLEIRGCNYILTAFTGKAVSRLHEIMRNKKAATIDRHIMKMYASKIKGDKNEKIDCIIIDEISMVNTELFYRLINQLDYYTKIILVGDQNQLPAVQAGSFMGELMKCGRIPIFYLTKNQRIISLSSNSSEKKEDNSEDKSGDKSPKDPGSESFDRAILENANSLIDSKRNKSKPMEYREGSGFYICEGSKETVKNILSQLNKAGCDKDKIVIISPYKAPLRELNSIFQNVFFGDSIDSDNSYMQPTPTGGRLWCIGDRVMMTSNNYKINVMNGEQGKVVSIEDSGVKIEFDDESQHLFKFQNTDAEVDKDGNPVDPNDVEEDEPEDKLYTDYIVHSSAISCHKSQGSEYEYVVLYIPEDRSFSNFLNINLLYTAITRTKKMIWVVSSKDTLERASMTNLPVRFDGLADMLRILRNESSEDILKSLIVKPDLKTESGSKSSTALTVVHESYDDCDDQ